MLVSLVPLVLALQSCQWTASGEISAILATWIMEVWRSITTSTSNRLIKMLTLKNLHLLYLLDGWYLVLYHNCDIDDPFSMYWACGSSTVLWTCESPASVVHRIGMNCAWNISKVFLIFCMINTVSARRVRLLELHHAVSQQFSGISGWSAPVSVSPKECSQL